MTDVHPRRLFGSVLDVVDPLFFAPAPPIENDPPLRDTVYAPATKNYPDPTGATPFHKVSTGDTNATIVKPSGGTIYGIAAFNINAAARYLKLYDIYGRKPIVGTDTPVHTFLIPGATTGGSMIRSLTRGVAFLNGIGFGLTTGMADTDTGAVAAADFLVEIDFL